MYGVYVIDKLSTMVSSKNMCEVIQSINHNISSEITSHKAEIQSNVFDFLQNNEKQIGKKGTVEKCVLDLFNHMYNLMKWTRPVYFLNMLIDDDDHIEKHLQTTIKEMGESNIQPGACFKELPGINTSMFYLGSSLSFSEMHIEDAKLESLNVVYFNLDVPNNLPSKAWIVIHPKEYAKFSMLVAMDFENKQKNSSKECPYILFHKNIYVTVDYLKRNKVEFEIVLQYPGDAVYVKSGAYHQVINLNTYLAEAINYGSTSWNSFTADQSHFCICSRNKMDIIYSNPEEYCVVRKAKVNNYVCEIDECAFSNTNWKMVLHHYKTNHDNCANAMKKLYEKYPERKKLLDYIVRFVKQRRWITADTCKQKNT